MAIPVARVHLKVAHAALPALLPTPPKWKMLPTPCVAAIFPKPPLTQPSRAAVSDERWDAHKAKPPAFPASSATASSLGRRSADSIRSSTAGHGSPRKNVISPPPKPGRADSAERWDAHKKTAILASSSSSSAGTSSLVSSTCKISRASSGALWDVHKKRRPSQSQAELLDDGESRSTGSNDMDTEEEEEEIVWKPQAMYAGAGFAVAATQPSVLPMPTTFLVRVA